MSGFFCCFSLKKFLNFNLNLNLFYWVRGLIWKYKYIIKYMNYVNEVVFCKTLVMEGIINFKVRKVLMIFIYNSLFVSIFEAI